MLLSPYLTYHMDPVRRHSPIQKNDLIPMDEYALLRDDFRKSILDIKKPRRVSVGPDITFYFEHRLTLLWQIHEMLFIEKGGDDQIDDELQAYNPLVPQSHACVATMMIEIADIGRRRVLLQQWGHIERHISLVFDSEKVGAVFEDDIERTTVDGKTSAVHFLHFLMSDAQKKAFQKATQATLCIEHPHYHHTAIISDELRRLLQEEMT